MLVILGIADDLERIATQRIPVQRDPSTRPNIGAGINHQHDIHDHTVMARHSRLSR